MVLISVSCAPTNWLNIDTINPATFTFPDTGKIVILNASYLPEVNQTKTNLITKFTPKEQLIYDTIIITHIFNGLFSVLNESTNFYIQEADYQEIRTRDTSNFLNPISAKGIDFLCNTYDGSFIVALEYFDFNRVAQKNILSYGSWQSNLEVSRRLVWRIYNKTGEILDQYIDTDTLYWYENIETTEPLPELTDAVREAFYFAGDLYAKRISTYWTELSRQYFLISINGEDVSLEREQLIALKDNKKKRQAFKARYNLAVLSESEDKLEEANSWLKEAYKIIQLEEVVYYQKKLETRLETRKIIDIQSMQNK